MIAKIIKTHSKTTILRDPELHLEVVGVLWERSWGQFEGLRRQLGRSWGLLACFVGHLGGLVCHVGVIGALLVVLGASPW